jgi:hypothetical protein
MNDPGRNNRKLDCASQGSVKLIDHFLITLPKKKVSTVDVVVR